MLKNGFMVCLLGLMLGVAGDAQSITIVYLDDAGNVLRSAPAGVKPIPIHSPWWSDKQWDELVEQPAPMGGQMVEMFQTPRSGVPVRSVFAIHTATIITIRNDNSPGEGLNDLTPAAPVGENPGTTLGEQRINALVYAAELWAEQLESSVEIVVSAKFEPLSCAAYGGVLGTGGPNTVHRNFANAPRANTFFVVAQTNAITGTDANGSVNEEIRTTYNSAVDNNDDCLIGKNWYYGFDGDSGGDIDLVEVALHEFAHGLGFISMVNETTGEKMSGADDIFSVWLRDETTGKDWHEMSNAERAASAINTGNLTWTGAEVTSRAGNYTDGIHASGHFKMYAPNPVTPGSSVSHFDISVTPDELMEPIRTGSRDLTLTTALFADLWWPLTDPVSPTETAITPSGVSSHDWLLYW